MGRRILAWITDLNDEDTSVNYFKLLFRKHKYILILLIVISALCEACVLASKFINANIIDLLVTGRFNDTYFSVALMVLIGVINIVSLYFLNLKKTAIETQMIFELENSVLQNSLRADYLRVKSFNSIYLSQRIHNDISSIVKFLVANFDYVFKNLFVAVVTLLALLNIHPFFFVTAAASLPPYVLLLLRYMKKIYQSGTKLKETRVKYSTNITEQVNNVYMIKCNNMYSKVETIFENFFSKLFNTVLNHFRNIFKFQSLDNIITVIIQILFLFFGVYLFSKNSITIGQLTITLSLYGMMITSVRYYVNLSVQYSECKASVARMDELSSIQSEKTGTMEVNGTIQNITINNLMFSFDNNNTITYPDTTLRPGDMLIVKGSNGKGKTTIINLLLGIYKCEKGRILYDGVDINDLDVELLRNHITYLAQEPLNWDITVSEMFSLYNGNITFESIHNLMDIEPELYNIFENASSIKDNSLLWNTRLSELSSGQRKKVNMAAVLMGCREFVVLDEPEAYIDAECVRLLISYLNRHKRGRIIVVITHSDIFDALANISLTI